ncbi:MAG: hypothetical protein RDU20_21835 [Desulfomonilaceae bacterium]|nr:hypothetical protein [Desulfomonilaceae bacterium]
MGRKHGNEPGIRLRIDGDMMTIDSDTAEREDFANWIIREFRPVVSKLGFGRPRWDYDPEFGVLRVQFEHADQEKAVQIDYDARSDLFSANYCRNEGEWHICNEGKPGKLGKLKGTVLNWLLDMCEECCVDCEPIEPWDEDEYALVPCSRCDDSGRVPKISP